MVAVKTTACALVPTEGTVAGDAKAKPPGTEAEPPLSVEAASACPAVMPLAVGQAVTVGNTFSTVCV